MSHGFLDIALTPSVRAAQEATGSDRIWQNFKGHRAFGEFTSAEAALSRSATVSIWRRCQKLAGRMSSTAAGRQAS
jgi:hypothetical protein